MKITYNNYPVLKNLETGKLKGTPIAGKDADSSYAPLKEMAIEGFEAVAPYFKTSIKVITKPFWEAVLKVQTHMIKDDIFQLSETASGTFILPSNLVICYLIEPFNLDSHNDRIIYVFQNGALLHYSNQMLVNGKASRYIWNSSIVTECSMYNTQEYKFWPDSQKREAYDNSFISTVIAFLNFLKYCPVETKHLDARKKDTSGKENHKNETNSNIKILDSKYFTTLIQSHGFGVKGHFRWQACGKMMQERKLIWIADFQKEGYTRVAGKLSGESNI